MKLLFDENLPPRLVHALNGLFPGSEHLRSVGLAKALDEDVWRYAREHAFTLVTKDADFHERSVVFGHPPKVVWIRRGNCTTAQLEQTLLRHASDIENPGADANSAFLILF